MKTPRLTESSAPQQVKLNCYNAKSFFDKILWHTHAATSVFGVMFLLTSSLIFITLHWIGKNLINFSFKHAHKNTATCSANFSINHENLTWK
jgi:hypothetical protein